MSYIYLFSISAGHSDWPVPKPPLYLSSQYFLYLSSLAFVLGTLIDQSQHRLSGLKSNSLRLFTSIWLACILSITVLVIFIATFSISLVFLCCFWYCLPLLHQSSSWLQYNVIKSHSRLVIAVAWCQCSQCPSFQSQSVNSIVDTGCCFNFRQNYEFCKGYAAGNIYSFCTSRRKKILRKGRMGKGKEKEQREK